MAPTINVRRSDSEALPNPEGANFFSFAFVGNDVAMHVGYVDPADVHVARASERADEMAEREGSEPIADDDAPTVHLQVTHRFHLSTTGLEQLKTQVDDIWRKLEALRGGKPAGGEEAEARE